MSAFEYIALDKNGRQLKGVMEGDAARQVRQLLREQELIPIEVKLISEQHLRRSRMAAGFFRRFALGDLALITRQLATLLAAGMPLEEVLQTVGEQNEKAYVKSTIFAVRSLVLEGHALATAMRTFPSAFPALYCATIAAGEQTGRLDAVLLRLADYVEQQQRIRQKIQQALIYPSMMVLISITIVTFLLIYVVPKMIGVFSNTGQALPDLTLFLIAISHGIKQYGVYIAVILITAIIIAQRLLRYDTYRRTWHKFLLKIPVFGYAHRIINTARFAKTFGILSTAGVSIIEAMHIAAELISNLPMRTAVQTAILRVQEGMHIHYALKQTGYFLPMSIHLIASGETSGQLENMLERAATNEEQEVERMIQTSLSLFEPLMILLMGVIVLFIVLAVLLPIFSLDQFAA